MIPGSHLLCGTPRRGGFQGLVLRWTRERASLRDLTSKFGANMLYLHCIVNNLHFAKFMIDMSIQESVICSPSP
jgi:hypothetical protein